MRVLSNYLRHGHKTLVTNKISSTKQDLINNEKKFQSMKNIYSFISQFSLSCSQCILFVALFLPSFRFRGYNLSYNFYIFIQGTDISKRMVWLLIALLAISVFSLSWFFQRTVFLLGTSWFIFNFAIVKHAKIADFLGTCWHTKILVGTLSYITCKFLLKQLLMWRL